MDERSPLLNKHSEEDGHDFNNTHCSQSRGSDCYISNNVIFSASDDTGLVSICYVDDGDGNPLLCSGYQRSIPRTILYHLLAFLTAGILYLVSRWKPLWSLLLTHRRCSFGDASKVLLKEGDGRIWIEDVTSDHESDYNNLHPNVYNDFHAISKDDAPCRESKRITDCESVRKRIPEQKGESEQTINDTKKKLADHSILQFTSKYFIHKELKYIFNRETKVFELLTGYAGKTSLLYLHQHSNGLSQIDEAKRLDAYGRNSIDVHVKSYARLFMEESADPFYVFQVFSCILWFSDEYYYYAAAILVISIVSICISIYQTRNHLISLRNMIVKSDPVQVMRPSGQEECISSDNLAIGDVIVVPPEGCNMHCDAILITGTAIVNESSLTGESVPVTKVAIPSPSANSKSMLEKEILDPKKHKRSILFCGSKVLQTRYYGNAKVLAVVYNTGFLTLKGNLVRSILYPKQVDFKFFTDALKFVCVLAVFAVLGLAYSVYIFYRDQAKIKEVVLRALDIITIAVPPALPAAMSVGVVYALQRLKKEGIFCISPSRINIAGKIKLFCFDKTGTLTEDGLDFFGIKQALDGQFQTFGTDFESMELSHFTKAIASCHSLTQLDGQLCGNPLDLKLFESVGWQLEEVGKETEHYETVAPTIVRPSGDGKAVTMEALLSGKPPLEIAILKQFPFSSDLQRMSVLVRVLGAPNMDIYTKGSPEIIAHLCSPDTVPPDFEEQLSNFTMKGCRVIAVAYKKLNSDVLWHQAQHFTRKEVENELSFLGLVVLHNTVKPETTPVIKTLRSADIRVVMITGDNLLTAVSVARECFMVNPSHKVIWVNLPEGRSHIESDLEYTLLDHGDTSVEEVNPTFSNQDYHYAMTGKTFSMVRNSRFYDRLLLCTTIYARMLPDQKAQLVEDLQKLGYGVGMCGDGANDCGALKTAHCGISLSEAEASVSSPFTSKTPNISCVINVIREGRCALVTSFSVFKYMALYSMVQYMTVLMLYYIQSNLGNFQYLYIDLILILPIAVTMSRTGPSPNLVSQRPLGSLIHPLVLVSIVVQILIQFGFQVGTWYFVKSLPSYKDVDWFRQHKKEPKDGKTQIICFENTGLFCITCYQYLFLAVAFATGKPYRKPFYTNIAMMVSIFVLVCLNIIFTYFNGHFLPDIMNLVVIDPRQFALLILELAALNGFLSVVIEIFIIPSSLLRWIVMRLRRKKGHKNLYKRIRDDMDLDASWPPHKR